jgi:voltage-gated sodium channel
MLCISIATISVGLQTYESLSDDPILDGLDFIILGVFIFECLFKFIAEGLQPWRYFSGKEMRWNTFDFIIIILSLPVWGSAFGGGNVAILRMMRLMRIMKLVKRIPQLYMIVMGLIGGLKSIGYILLLLFLVFYLYAVSGMYAWSNNDPFHFRSIPIAMVTLFRMATLENWSSIMNINYFGCDQFFGGYYTLNEREAGNIHQFCNVTKAYGGTNVTEEEKESQRFLQHFISTFYFITFILISAFVMLSLFIGAITMSMTSSMEQMKAAQEAAERKERVQKAKKRAEEAERRERERIERLAKETTSSTGSKTTNLMDQQDKKLSAAEKRDRQKMREVLMQTWDDCDLTDMLTQQLDTSTLKGKYLKMSNFTSKMVDNPKFSNFITIVIILAGILVGLQTSDNVEDKIGDVLNGFDAGILAVFTIEVIIKIVAEGMEPWNYLKSAWNVFDFVIVVGSFTKGSGGMLTMLRLLRLLRVLKLVKAFPQLQVIVSALMKGVSSIGYIGLILLLCFYVFAIIGNILFKENDPYHFGKLHFAMLSLFQCATMDSWSDVLYINYYGCDAYGYEDYKAIGYSCDHQPKGFIAVIYFIAFIVLGAMVLITLFIGVVTTSMEEATQEMEEEKELLCRIEKLRISKGIEETVVNSYMQVFRMLDLDGSGSVEEAELRIGLAAIGKYPTYEELKEMLDVVDEDGSGQIDIVEFVEFMINVRAKSIEAKQMHDAAHSALNGTPENITEEPDAVTLDEENGDPLHIEEGRAQVFLPHTDNIPSANDQSTPVLTFRGEVSMKHSSYSSSSLDTATPEIAMEYAPPVEGSAVDSSFTRPTSGNSGSLSARISHGSNKHKIIPSG